jgi:hypothetical protein
MADRYFQQFRGSLDREVVKLYGKVTFGASGAVSSQDCLGFTVTKTATKTGRYTVTLDDTYPKFLGCNVSTEIATDAAHTATVGLQTALRNVSVNDATPTFEIQYIEVDGSSGDANPASGAVAYIEVILKNATE